MSRVDAAVLEQFAARLVEEAGASAEDAHRVAESLVSADLRGHFTHGTFRIPWYLESIEETDWIDPTARPVVERETPVTGVVDGKHAFGPVAGKLAMDLAIEKADEFGVGVVGVKDSTHLGRIGQWAEQATDEGYIGMLQVGTQGGSRTVAPAGTADRRYSTNPIAFGIPTYGALEFPIVLDIATSQVAHGKIRVRANEGDEIPDGWAVDKSGAYFSDAAAFVEDKEAALLPLGGITAGYKGFGLSVVAELVSSIIGDGKATGQQDIPRSQNIASCIVIDPTRFTTPGEIKERIEAYATHIRETDYDDDVPMGPGAKYDAGLLPGEPEYKTYLDYSENGIELSDETKRDLHEMAVHYGIEDESPFSTVSP